MTHSFFSIFEVIVENCIMQLFGMFVSEAFIYFCCYQLHMCPGEGRVEKKREKHIPFHTIVVLLTGTVLQIYF